MDDGKISRLVAIDTALRLDRPFDRSAFRLGL